MTLAAASHPEARTARARAAFMEVRGLAEVPRRQAEIDTLPRVLWRGRVLYTLRCHGTSGKGPHDTNVPEALLWALIDLRAFRCPYHANDVLESDHA